MKFVLRVFPFVCVSVEALKQHLQSRGDDSDASSVHHVSASRVFAADLRTNVTNISVDVGERIMTVSKTVANCDYLDQQSLQEEKLWTEVS